jgi:hypothetical protein
MEAKLYGQNKGGMSINGIIKDYYAYAGENISAGDLVEYVNGIAGSTNLGTSVETDLVTSKYAGYKISAVALNENKVFIAHSYSTSYYLYGVVVTIDGASLVVGTDTQLNSTTYKGQGISAVALDENRVFIAHGHNSNTIYLYGMVVTIDGTTITAGTDTALNTSMAGTGYNISTCLLPNGNVFIAHSYGDSSNSGYQLYAMVVTIAGTKITKGTDTAISTVTRTGSYISTCLLPNGNVFIAYGYEKKYYLYGVVCTIDGATITKGANTALNTTLQGAGLYVSAVSLPNGNVFISHGTLTDYYLYAIVVSIEGTTITAGTDTMLSEETYMAYQTSSLVLSNDKVLIVHTNTYSQFLSAMIVAVNNLSITVISETVLNTNKFTGNKISPLLLPNGSIFIAHCYDSSNYYLHAQVFGIDSNNAVTNNISILDYETQIRKVTTGQFDGIAKTSGEGGDNTGHKDMVSIWTKVPIVTQEFAMADGNILADANGDIFLVREAS